MCLFNFHMQNKYADEYNAKMNELKKEEREFFNKQREGKHAPLDISPSLCVCAFVCMCMFGFVSFLFFLFFSSRNYLQPSHPYKPLILLIITYACVDNKHIPV